MVKRYFYSAGSVMIVVIFLVLIREIQIVSEADLNKLFLVGIFSLLVGACMYVLNTGFLNLFFQGFKSLGSMTIKKPASMKEVDDLIEADHIFKEWKNKFSSHLMTYSLGMGTGLLLLSTVWSLNL
ncbi:DUF3899 domain-containing protein [Paenisporosarcina indica]|uniref:DUF3899 domain-containing protein n=1 Tax=Paenisporosarcina indica TaxID=650093 RepID=UPI00094F6B5F|nr:DUF3899 domain-containing protein [Paenisporosarcina indica]